MENGDLKPIQPWGSNERTIWVGERDPKTGSVPVRIPNNGPNSGGSFLTGLLEDWKREKNPLEYAAGFRARMAEVADADGRHPCWRSGWNDADTELLEQARHRSRLEEGREDDFPGTRRLLYDAGHMAREDGVLFDKARTEPWKEGWVVADIAIGAEPAFDSKAGAAEGGSMPIKREHKSRYPSEWAAISNRIRFERASGRCEFPGCATVHGQPHPLTGATVVLTVAHLDHTPENRADDNLLAGCQRCHNRYDRAHRLTTRNAAKRSLMLRLPFGEPES